MSNLFSHNDRVHRRERWAGLPRIIVRLSKQRTRGEQFENYGGEVKLISDDRTFIYFFYNRFDGRSEGIRVGMSAGAIGFISDTLAKDQRHPIVFLKSDEIAIQLPTRRVDFPPILRNVMAQVEREHPEINGII